jgi:hypothetical protein
LFHTDWVGVTSNAVEAIGGTTEGAEDESDPIDIFQRGIYFDGADDYLTLASFIISFEFTIQAWVRIDSVATAGATIYSVQNNSDLGNEDRLLFSLNTDLTTTLAIRTANLIPISATSNADAFELKNWVYVITVAAWDGDMYSITFYRNVVAVGSTDVAVQESFLGDASNTHVIGA